MQLLVRAYWDFDRIATEGEGKEHASTALRPHAAGCDGSRDDEGENVGDTTRIARRSILIQYGKPRTATTLQFITLCAISSMVFKGGDSSECVTPRQTPEGSCTRMAEQQNMREIAGATSPDYESVPHPVVCKTHVLKDALDAASWPNTMLFVTASSNTTGGSPGSTADSLMTSWRRQLNKDYANVTLGYVAHAAALKSRDDLLLQDYAELFGLKAEQVAAIQAYLEASPLFIRSSYALLSHSRMLYVPKDLRLVPRTTIPRFNSCVLTDARPLLLLVVHLLSAQLWDKLRLCCGAQMSATYREELANVTWRAKSYWGEETARRNICDSLDLSSAEKQLMQTDVYTNASGVDMLKRLSTADQMFDGSYCDRAKEATIRLRLKFNDKRYLDI